MSKLGCAAAKAQCCSSMELTLPNEKPTQTQFVRSFRCALNINIHLILAQFVQSSLL